MLSLLLTEYITESGMMGDASGYILYEDKGDEGDACE